MSFSAFAFYKFSHGQRVLRAAYVTWAVAFLALGLGAMSAQADTCGNAGLRALNNSGALPDCRAYEMVSSPYKQGFDLIPQTFSDDGIVSYLSTGSFVGNGIGLLNNKYLGVRTPEGWKTQSLNPSLASYGMDFESNIIFASDMRSSVMTMSSRDPSGGGQGFYVRDFNGTFTRVGKGPVPPSPEAIPALQVLDASDDLSHVVFGGLSIWAGLEYVGVGDAAVLRQENVDNDGVTVPGTSCAPEGISGDGRVLVFGCPGARLWARIGGATTVAVSGSECTRGPLDPGGACNGLSAVNYVGAAADGSRVFMTTDQQLVNTDTDSTTDLYACDIPSGSPAPVGAANPCATLTAVSGASGGARVESVVAVSEDGSRVYFVAQGVLADNPGTGGVVAVSGDDNLYVWTKDAAHPTGATRFVTKLDPGNGVVGAQTTKDGRYLVFSTTTKLVSSGPGKDDDGQADMYRYDAESETMLRLSTSVTGSGGDGPFDASSRRSFRRSASNVSADASMVVFETDEALSPDDTDGAADVYLWRDGRVSLISRGGGEQPWISATGEDIFFVTNQRLTAGDRDANVDIYDARVGGGFDLTHPVPCSGDACQGPSSAPPGLSSPLPRGSGGDEAEVVPALSLRRVSAAQRRRLVATGKVNVVVSASAAGVLRATATATLGGRSITVASARRTLTAAGTATMSLTLSKKARTQLAARRRLTVKVSVSHSKIALNRSMTLSLVRSKAKKPAIRSSDRQAVDAVGARS